MKKVKTSDMLRRDIESEVWRNLKQMNGAQEAVNITMMIVDRYVDTIVAERIMTITKLAGDIGGGKVSDHWKLSGTLTDANAIDVSFDTVWDAWKANGGDRRHSQRACDNWKELTDDEKRAAIAHIPSYLEVHGNAAAGFSSYLNNKMWQ